MNFQTGDIYSSAIGKNCSIKVLRVDEIEPRIHWQWIDWSEESLPLSTSDFNNLIEMWRMTKKIKETTTEKILRLRYELEEAGKQLEYEEMYAKVGEMNKTMTIGQLETFYEVVRAYVEDKRRQR